MNLESSQQLNLTPSILEFLNRRYRQGIPPIELFNYRQRPLIGGVVPIHGLISSVEMASQQGWDTPKFIRHRVETDIAKLAIREPRVKEFLTHPEVSSVSFTLDKDFASENFRWRLLLAPDPLMIEAQIIEDVALATSLMLGWRFYVHTSCCRPYRYRMSRFVEDGRCEGCETTEFRDFLEILSL